MFHVVCHEVASKTQLPDGSLRHDPSIYIASMLLTRGRLAMHLHTQDVVS